MCSVSHAASVEPRSGMSTDREIDRLFTRFRRRGDLTSLARVFDATAPELLRIAMYLVRDAHAAEDLVQSTFLVAIEHAAQHERGRRALPWLLGILANRARELRKERARVPDPERIADRQVTRRPTDPADDAARTELAAEMTRALRSLPPPYGEVLALHLEHGRTAKEIGVALQRPAGTVRTQVVRGMELLRRALPAGLATTALVVTQGRGLAAVRETVLAAGSRYGPSLAAAGAGVALLSVQKLLLAGALLGAIATAWLIWSASPEETTLAPHASEAEVLAARAPSPEDASISHDAGSTTSPRIAVEASTGTLSLELLWDDDGTPAAAVEVTCYDHTSPERHKATTDARGAATIAGLPAGAIRVRTDREQEPHDLEVEAGTTTRVTLRLRPEVVIEGVVADPAGAPVAGARVRTPNRAELPTLTNSRADGSFAWRGMRVVEIWAEQDGRAPSRLQLVPGSDEPRHPMELRLGVTAPSFSGMVLDPSGRPASGASVAIAVDDAPPPVLRDGRRARNVPPVLLTTDESGRFTTSSVPIGKHWLVACAAGSAPAFVEVEIFAVARAPVVVQLEEGAAVHGIVRDAQGEPVPAARVSAGTKRAYGHGFFPLGGRVTDRQETVTDGEGRFALQHLFAGEVQIYCRAQGMTTVDLDVDLSQRRELEWNPVLERQAEIRGRVVDASGQPLVGWRVHLETEPSTASASARVRPQTLETQSEGDGRFTLLRVFPGSYRLWAVPPDAEGAAASAEWGPTRAVSGETDVLIRTGWEPDAGAFAVGRLVDRDGVAVSAARIELRPPRHRWTEGPGTSVDADGAFRIGPLPSGEFELVVSSGSHDAVQRRVRIEPGRTLDLGAIVLEPRK